MLFGRRIDGVRTYADGVLTSTDGPALRLRVASEFTYLGHFAFDLGGIARVERHVFAGVTDRTVRRLIVVHFEEFPPGSVDVYRYAPHDGRILGDATYGRSASLLSVGAERNAAPKAEMARTDAFIRGKGLSLPDRHAVARYARIVGAERRRELLLFYHECDGALTGILERAERAFELMVGPVQSVQ
jgi:hypothetical protein